MSHAGCNCLEFERNDCHNLFESATTEKVQAGRRLFGSLISNFGRELLQSEQPNLDQSGGRNEFLGWLMTRSRCKNEP